jgi:hypothetical protein
MIPVELFHWFEAVQAVPGLQSVVRPTAQSFLRQNELTLIYVPVNKNTIPFHISFDLSFFKNKAVTDRDIEAEFLDEIQTKVIRVFLLCYSKSPLQLYLEISMD